MTLPTPNYPCALEWSVCDADPLETHRCGRLSGHNGIHRCVRCDASKEPFFTRNDPKQYHQARNASVETLPDGTYLVYIWDHDGDIIQEINLGLRKSVDKAVERWGVEITEEWET